MTLLKPLFLVFGLLLLISFQPANQSHSIRISANQISGVRPESITVEITNNENTVLTLRNLRFDFFIDDDSFYAIPESARFVDTFLTLKPKAQYSRIIALDSMTFVANVNNIEGFNQVLTPAEIREKFKKSQSVKFRATMETVQNPKKSPTPDLLRSNVIKISTQ